MLFDALNKYSYSTQSDSQIKELDEIMENAKEQAGHISENNGNIKGVEKDNTQSIRSQISSHCDPPPNVEIGIQEIDNSGKKIIYIRVPKGDNTPYTLLEHGIFVRHGSSDMHARRSEIDKLTKSDRKNGYNW